MTNFDERIEPKLREIADSLPPLGTLNIPVRYSDLRDDPDYALNDYELDELTTSYKHGTWEETEPNRGAALVPRSFIYVAVCFAGGWKGAPLHLRKECTQEAFYRLAERWELEPERDQYGDVCFWFGGGEIPALIRWAQKLYRKRITEIAETRDLLEEAVDFAAGRKVGEPVDPSR